MTLIIVFALFIVTLMMPLFTKMSRHAAVLRMVSAVTGGIVMSPLLAIFDPFFLLIYLLFLALYLWKIKISSPEPDAHPMKIRVMFAFDILLVIGVAFWYYQAEITKVPSEGFNLKNPISVEGAVVHKGGNSTIFNHHTKVPRERWAADIALPLGFSEIRGLVAKKLEDFRIFGVNLSSPCGGVVSNVVDGFEDQAVGKMDKKNPAGNHVEITCKGQDGKEYLVRLAHLQKGSTTFKAGDSIKSGDILGKVGNSGNTSMPHLHIDVIESESGKAVPIFIQGKFTRAFTEL